ncbi:MAG: formate/nitrite transporter family protein [Acidobacteriota bacterium]|nr:formate/nitrite transporter family protein [Acidobacteriota bacterium]
MKEIGKADSGEQGPDLTEREQHEVHERSAPRTEVVYEAIRKEGENELKRSAPTLAYDGLTAGLSMGFSFVAEALLRSHLPNTAWRPAVVSLGYSVGFLMVVMGRQQLFTENTLTVILPLLRNFDAFTLKRVLKVWSVVLVANLLGALLFALVVGHTELFKPEVRAAFGDLAREALEGGWGLTLIRGIFAGWLIALMVWMLPAAESARVLVVIIMTYVVAFGGFAHIIVGSVELFYLVTTGGANWSDYFGWMLPTLLGNIIGGTTLVAALGHAQVVSESEGEL